MKVARNLKWIGLIFSCLQFAAFQGFAGQEGNGGGGWVCREPSGAVRFAWLVDLFEASEGYGLPTVGYPGSYEEIVNGVSLRLMVAHRKFYEEVAKELRKLNYLRENPPAVKYVGDRKLPLVQDVFFRVEPGRSDCPGGTIAYEQVVNYLDGNILVKNEIFLGMSELKQGALSNTANAALVMHEAIYAVRRAIFHDTDSNISRQIVGWLFSTLPEAELSKRLEALLGEKYPEFDFFHLKFFEILKEGDRPDEYLIANTSYNILLPALNEYNPEPVFPGYNYDFRQPQAVSYCESKENRAGWTLPTLEDARFLYFKVFKEAPAPEEFWNRMNFSERGNWWTGTLSSKNEVYAALMDFSPHKFLEIYDYRGELYPVRCIRKFPRKTELSTPQGQKFEIAEADEDPDTYEDFKKRDSMPLEDARKACAAKGSGWALPDQEELNEIFRSRAYLSELSTSNYYWSSTEQNGFVWAQGMGRGIRGWIYKDPKTIGRARCIRRVQGQ